MTKQIYDPTMNLYALEDGLYSLGVLSDSVQKMGLELRLKSKYLEEQTSSESLHRFINDWKGWELEPGIRTEYGATMCVLEAGRIVAMILPTGDYLTVLSQEAVPWNTPLRD